jgi:catechol 2,3-dioxygenase-like lactoylglutathione lyase family enzyme
MEVLLGQHLSLTTLVVRDYDEALAFYVGKLGFEMRDNTRLDDHKRWVVVAPPGSSESGLLLAKAATARQAEAIGNQSGGRVFLFLVTDNFHRDHERFVERGVSFVEAPRVEPYGTVAVFEDLYGNRWDLIERR